MTPKIVHRYTWPVREAIEALLGDAVGDCETWRIRVDGEEVVIDVVGPAEVTFRVGDYEYTVDGRGQQPSNDASKSDIAASEAEAAPAEPPRKGGPLARQAGIICGEKGFWTFLTKKFGAPTESAEAATNWLREDCAIKSRVDLDYEPAAAERFKEIARRYALWLEGFD